MINRFLICFLILIFSISASCADVYLLVNKTNEEALDSTKLKSILGAQTLSWETGKPIVLMIDEYSVIDSDTISRVVGLTKNQFIELWRVKFFSGRALIPKQVKTEKQALQMIEENPSSLYVAMGRIPENIQDNPSVRVVKLTY